MFGRARFNDDFSDMGRGVGLNWHIFQSEANTSKALIKLIIKHRTGSVGLMLDVIEWREAAARDTFTFEYPHYIKFTRP